MKKIGSGLKKPLIIFLAVFVLSGCIKFGISGRKSAPQVELYVPEYPSPVFKRTPAINAAIKVDRFSTAGTFDTTGMIYSPGGSRRDAYNYSRWRAAPGEMAGEFLLRDLLGAKIFWAVFPYAATEQARFKIDGTVEKFLEVDQNGGNRAILHMVITLMDMTRTDLPEHVLFQRRYDTSEDFGGNSAQAFASGMSEAMERMSRQILTDVYTAASESAAYTAGAMPRGQRSRQKFKKIK